MVACWFALLLGAGCAGAPGTECAVKLVVPEGVSAPVGEATDLTVRFVNGSGRSVVVSGLSLEPAGPVSFRDTAAGFTLPAGTCEQPAELPLVLRFSPTAPGRTTTVLHLLLDGVPSSSTLELTGLGARLTTSEVVNFGVIGLAPTPPQSLVVSNDGTLGSELVARVEAINSTNGAEVSELCVGSLDGAKCVGAPPLTVKRSAAFPIVISARAPGLKAWEVAVRANDDRHTTRVLAEVVDTSGCELSASVPQLTFGLVFAPERETRSVRFTNQGSGPCVLRGVTTTAPFRVLRQPPVRLEAGEAFSLDVEVSLTQPSSATGRLRLALAPSRPEQPAELELPLRAETPASCLSVTPAAVDFGGQVASCSAPERLVQLTNVCASSLVVSGLGVDLPFRLLRAPTLPAVLSPASSVVLTLGFTAPEQLGNASGALRITLASDEVFVTLTGRAETPSPSVDQFSWDARSSADLLVVLDDSPSFARQHQRVRTELARLFTSMQQQSPCVDFRLGVTTTDVSAAGPRGALRETDAGVKWATVDSTGSAAAFSELSALSTTGAEHQSCLEAAGRAVSEPLRSGGNAGFQRPGAQLAVLCITDDLDGVATPAPWRTALTAAGATYSVIGPIGSTCTVDALDDGTHAANVALFGGALGDICQPWNALFLGAQCAPRTTLFLTAQPRVETLAVEVDGAALPAIVGTEENWRYDAGANAIVLSATVLARHPRAVTVHYRRWCS